MPDGPFAKYAGAYLAAGLMPVPCGGTDGKRPLVPWGDLNVDVARNRLDAMVRRHGGANVGVVTGTFTVVDVDDPAYIDAMLYRCGDTPVIGRTPRGGHHLWYQGRGERTVTRLDDLPVDVRGMGGLVVVPPSVRPSDGIPYVWEGGGLEDLPFAPPVAESALPLANERARPGGLELSPLPGGSGIPPTKIKVGQRNHATFLHAMQTAHRCRTADELRALVHQFNVEINSPPLPEQEVESVVNSALKYQTEGRNHVGRGRYFPVTLTIFDLLNAEPDALLLLTLLRFKHGQREQPFAVSSKALSDSGLLPWGPRKITKARNVLVAKGFLVRVRYSRGKGDPHQYVFTNLALFGAFSAPNIRCA